MPKVERAKKTNGHQTQAAGADDRRCSQPESGHASGHEPGHEGRIPGRIILSILVYHLYFRATSPSRYEVLRVVHPYPGDNARTARRIADASQPLSHPR